LLPLKFKVSHTLAECTEFLILHYKTGYHHTIRPVRHTSKPYSTVRFGVHYTETGCINTVILTISTVKVVKLDGRYPAMNNLSYLNHLMTVTDMVKAGPGGNQEGSFETDPNAQATVEETSLNPYPNPFEVNQPSQLNVLDGELGDGIEYLLPNASLRHKLAYLRIKEKLHQLNTLNNWIAPWPLPDSLKDRLQAKCKQLVEKQSVIEAHMQQDAVTRFGWFSKLGGLLKRESVSSQALDSTTAARLLWQLAQSPEEKAIVYSHFLYDNPQH
jgi:hypothetical protein